MTQTHKSKPPVLAGNGEQLLTRRLLRRLVPVSDMTIWRWERDGRFPRHIAFNGRNYWLLSEVQQWLTSRERGQVPTNGGRNG